MFILRKQQPFNVRMAELYNQNAITSFGLTGVGCVAAAAGVFDIPK